MLVDRHHRSHIEQVLAYRGTCVTVVHTDLFTAGPDDHQSAAPAWRSIEATFRDIVRLADPPFRKHNLTALYCVRVHIKAPHYLGGCCFLSFLTILHSTIRLDPDSPFNFIPLTKQ